MTKAIAIIPGFRARTTEYLKGIQEGAYDLALLLSERSQTPFAFMTTHSDERLRAAENLATVFTTYAKDQFNNPQAFVDHDVYVARGHGKRGRLMLCGAKHMETLGFNPSSMHVFYPERLGEVYKLSAQGNTFNIEPNRDATTILRAAIQSLDSLKP